MARLDSFLRLVVEQAASDLHFSAGTVPTIRHDGDLLRLPFRTMSETETRRFLLEILTPEQRTRFAAQNEFDFVYALEGIGRFRANYFQQARGMGAVFRIIPDTIPSVADLGLPPAVKKLTEIANGLCLVTGPTGAGKTTTLAAIVSEINRTQPRHIITIEDPIEFIHTPMRSLVTQRQVGIHAESFSAALRSALRESPDVIVVGEMRDLETIQLALSAAETGVLVFGTLHTNSAATAIDRIIDAAPEEAREQVRGILSVLLRGIVAQHLVKRSSGEGRVAVLEILLQSFAVSHMIREGKVHQIDGLLQSSENAGTGMISLDTCLLNYMRQGIITVEDGLRIAKDPEHLRQMTLDIAED
ncbi:MAG: PilT/PilU family type 4a pilus ATPase [Deltaproteobacteria bacterium]|nr:PilT/PilU family type 4a pilus ATPase [Deltaproteobacteria bacterium]